MKTVKEWLEMLKEPYRTQALENTSPKSLKHQYQSLARALNKAFNWLNSPQGHEHWQNIHNNIENYMNPENKTIDLSVLPSNMAEQIQNLYNVMLPYANVNPKPEPEQPKPVSVEDICGEYLGWTVNKFTTQPVNCGTKILNSTHALTVLMLCAERVNDGELPVPDGQAGGVYPFIHGDFIEMAYDLRAVCSPLYLKSEDAYQKFIAIVGIEKYIRMYYGVENKQ